MKKTFKRAGVAVLSMAMLLSMGAIGGLTASAANEALTVSVNQVRAKGNEGNNVISNVKVYQVAKMNANTNHWEWNSPFTTIDSTSFENLGTLSAAKLNELARALKTTATSNPSSVANYLVLNQNATTDSTLGYASAAVSGTIQDVSNGASVTGTGYYLVIPTSADTSVIVQPALVQITSTDTTATSVTAKANPLPFKKTILSTTDGNTSNSGETSVGAVGSTVTYQIKTELPTYDSSVQAANIKNFVIVDDPSSGITINSDFSTAGSNVVVKFDSNDAFSNGSATSTGTVGTSSVSVAQSGDGFTVTVPGDVVNANQGREVTVTFKATIANIGASGSVTGNNTVSDYATAHQNYTGNPNTATLTYGNNFSTGGYADPNGGDDLQDDPTPDKSTVTTYIGKVDFTKYKLDSTGNKTTNTLQGATFTLTKSGDTSFGTSGTETKSSDANGVIDFGYLPAGTYTLTETHAPNGYKTCGETYTFTVTTSTTGSEFDTYAVTSTESTKTNIEFINTAEANNSQASIKVYDPTADTLPGTGGMGTTLFTVGGAVIVLMAGFMFVLYMRKRKTEE